MKSSIKKSLLVLASALLLAGCGDGGSSDNGGGNSSGGGLTPSSDSSVVEATYAVVDRASGNGISLSFDKTKAKKGETVTITVALESGYILNALYANKKECTKVNDATYTFVMGDAAVAITASLSIDGDVVTSGDVAIALDKQADGTYKGSFTAEKATSFLIKVGNVEYGFGNVDFDRSYGDIDDVYVSGSKGTTQIKLASNAVYEISFDLSYERPIAIYRTGILHAPANADEIISFFCGNYEGRNVLDNGAYNVKNLNHVEYSSTRAKINYVWDLHEDGSLATITDKLLDTKSYVYKSVKDGVYTVVDEYAETVKDDDGYLDTTKTEDSKKYSGKYSIVDEVTNSHYQRTATQASRDIATPSHELHSIYNEIMNSSNVGFVIEDTLKGCKRTFSVETKADGSFETKVVSWKNYEDDEANQERYAYETSIDINADGTLKSVSYLESYYTKAEWSFDNTDLENGGTAIVGMSPTIKQKSSVSYGYGNASSSAISFDVTPYFISSLDKITIKSNELTDAEDNHVKYMEVLDADNRDPNTKTVEEDSAGGYTTTLNISYSPSTALDLWEYGIISSDDSSMVAKSEYRPYEWVAIGSGTTNVTIGNHSTNTLTKKASVTIDDAPVPTGYYVAVRGDQTSDDVPSASSLVVKAGTKMSFYLWASPAECVAKPIVTSDNDSLKITVSDSQVVPTEDANWNIKQNPVYLMTLDATSITTETSISAALTVVDARDSNTKSTIKVTIKPKAKSAFPDSIEGTTWTAHDYVGVDGVSSTDPRYMSGSFVAATLSFTSDDGKEYDGTMYKKGALTVTGSSGLTTYDFHYNYYFGDTGDRRLKIRGATGSVDFGCDLLEEYGLIGIYACSQTWEGGDSTTSDYIIGYPEEEDDVEEYEWFTLDA